MPTFKIDGYTFLPGEEPARGPIVGISPQRWSAFPVLGAVSPGTILTYLGNQSQEWDYVSRASAATAAKLLAVFDAKAEVTFITPQNTDGFKVIMTRLKVPHETPIEGSKYLCEFTLMSREAVAGGIVGEEEDVPMIVRKTANQTLNNVDTLTDDTELFFAAGANEVWVGSVHLDVAIKAASDMRVIIDAPAGAGLQHIGRGAYDHTAGNEGILRRGTQINPKAASDLSVGVVFDFIVIMGGTAGNIQLQWCQFLAQVEDTIVKTGSWLIAWKQ